MAPGCGKAPSTPATSPEPEPGPRLEDVEPQALAAVLEPHGRQVRFFRFPMLREGDTVLVADGTYQENLDFAGKAILLRSDRDGIPATYDIDPCPSLEELRNG